MFLPLLLSGQLDSALYYSHVDTATSNKFLIQAYGSRDLIPDLVTEIYTLNYLIGCENYEDAYEFIEPLLEKHKDNPSAMVKLNNLLARIYNKLDRTEESENISKRIIFNAYATANDKVIALNNLADMMLNANNTVEALTFLKYANVIAKNHHCPELAQTELYLSFAYVNEGLNNKVEATLQRAMQYVKYQYNPITEAKILNNIGVYYFINEKFDSARHFFNELYFKAKKFNLYHQEIISLFNLSNVEYNDGNLEGAMEYLNQVNTDPEKVGTRLMSRVLYTYGVIYYDQGQYQKALSFLNEAVEMGLADNNHNILLLTYETLAQCYAAAGMYQQAFETQHTYSILSDSINDADRMMAFEIFESEIDLLEKDKKIIQQDLNLFRLKQENQKIRNNIKNILIFGTLALLIIINVSIFVVLRKKYELRKQFAKDVIIENEKFRYHIASELHDDIGQQLSLLTHREDINRDSDLKGKIQNALESLRGLSKLIYPQALNIMGIIPMLRKILRDIEENNKISTHLFAEEELEEMLNADQKLNIFRVLQECISNSIKHSNATILNININLDNKFIQVIYRDNGKQEEQKKLHYGFGLASMTMRAEMIDAKIQFTLNPNGFIMNMQIPIKTQNGN